MSVTIAHRNVRIDDIDVFYREVGPQDGPVLLLLHGFPSSSHMFRNLIPVLADKYHVVAPDFPGYGQSAAAIYLSDIGSSVGYRLAVKHPDRVTALVIQNGEAYLEGINQDFIKPLFAYWQDRSVANEKP